MTEAFDLTSYLVTVCPALGILAWVVIYFKGELKRKDERIEKLTNDLVESSSEAIKMYGEVKNILDILKHK